MNEGERIETIHSDLGEELRRLLQENYGTTAGKTQVLLSEDAVVVFLDALELQRIEEFLIEHGEEHIVIANRSAFQQAIESTFRASVERIIGRQVVSFASITKLNPHYAVEIFRLGSPTGALGELPDDPA